MKRLFVVLCCLLSACAVPVEESDPIENNDPTLAPTDTWQPQNPKPPQPDPCAPFYNSMGVPIPVLCAPYWFDTGDPPPDQNPMQKYQAPDYSAPDHQ